MGHAAESSWCRSVYRRGRWRETPKGTHQEQTEGNHIDRMARHCREGSTIAKIVPSTLRNALDVGGFTLLSGGGHESVLMRSYAPLAHTRSTSAAIDTSTLAITLSAYYAEHGKPPVKSQSGSRARLCFQLMF